MGHKKLVTKPKEADYGRRVSLLRRSNAAGLHGRHRKPRAATRRAAIEYARI